MLLSDLSLLDRSVLLKDGRLTARVLRDVNRVRRSIHPSSASRQLQQQSTASATSAATPPRSTLADERDSSAAASSSSAASPAASVLHLAALFAVIQSLQSAPSPPHSLQHIRDTLTRKDDTAQQAWQEAQVRGEKQREREETERKQKADSAATASQLRGVEQAKDDLQPMQIEEKSKQQHAAAHQDRDTATPQQHGQTAQTALLPHGRVSTAQCCCAI